MPTNPARAAQPALPDIPQDTVGRVGFGALLLALALAPILGGYPAGAAYGAEISLGALRCLVFVAALCLLGSNAGKPPASVVVARVASAALWSGIGLSILSLLVQSRFLTSQTLLFAMLPAALDWVCYGLLFTLALRFGQGKAAWWLVGAMVAGAAVAGFMSVQEYGQFVQGGSPEQRAQGTFFSPNFAAGLMALSLPVVVAWCVGVRERLLSIVLGAVAAILAGALFAAGSRAGVAVTAVGLLVALVLSVLRLKSVPGVWGRIAALIAVFAVLAFAFRGPLAGRVEKSGQEQSGPFRSWTWKGTLAMAQANPVLGAGPGTFPYVYPRYSLVARTDLAHSSYLQLAAEQGFPALILVIVGLGAAVLGAGMGLLRTLRSDDDSVAYLLKAGLLGGLLAGLARSVVDSEWSILGNAFAFFTVAGLALSLLPAPSPVASKAKSLLPFDARLLILPAILTGFVLSVLCLNTAQTRGAIQGRIAQGERSDAQSLTDYGWPTDPQQLYYAGKLAEAAEIEPTGRRFYQLGRLKSERGDAAGAIAALKQSVVLEPTALQSWRKLAELQERAGDAAGALESWGNLVKQQEGLPGKVRAIPEMTETHPAFAYAALARAAAKQGNISEAAAIYEKAAQIVENYAATAPLYQQMEIATAERGGVDVGSRRKEIRTLYVALVGEWAGLQKERAAELDARRDATLAALDKMLLPTPQTGQ